MAKIIREMMTPDPVVCSPETSLRDAARMMRDHDIGDVLVADAGRLMGIVTDRDLVVRGVAEGMDPSAVTVGSLCSTEIRTLAPDDSIREAVDAIRDYAIRRLPVVENGMPVGMVSLGDLALEQDPGSALADISAAPATQ